MKTFTLLLATFWTTSLAAQKDTSSITIGGYADSYYSWYSSGNRSVYQQHDAIGAYHNNFGLNIAQFSAAFNSDRFRGKATFHFGDIPQITWQPQYRNIQEANAGVRIAKKLWLDVGYFHTHVGTESFLPKENLMSILTLATFYGPFYQGGARLSYDTDSKWHFELHAINGYNRHVDDNEFKTFGVLVSKELNKKVQIGYSNMFGQENTGMLLDGYLVYQNLHANISLKKWDIQLGGDVAMANQWNPRMPANERGWTDQPLYNGLAAVKYHFNERFALALRGEVFSDESSINSYRIYPVLGTVTVNGIETENLQYQLVRGMTIYGGTISAEYRPGEFGFVRLESRFLYEPNPPYTEFPTGISEQVLNYEIMFGNRAQVMATIGFYFDKSFKFSK